VLGRPACRARTSAWSVAGIVGLLLSLATHVSFCRADVVTGLHFAQASDTGKAPEHRGGRPEDLVRNRPTVLVWLEVVTAELRFPVLADGALGGSERQALIEAADRQGVPLLLPRKADAYLLGHVASETSGEALAPVRRMARGGGLLAGTIVQRADGYCDVSWLVEDHRNARMDVPGAESLTLERVTLDVVMQRGMELAANVLARRP
jgi:hypothetical protein